MTGGTPQSLVDSTAEIGRQGGFLRVRINISDCEPLGVAAFPAVEQRETAAIPSFSHALPRLAPREETPNEPA
jgi:hypothetical protein